MKKLMMKKLIRRVVLFLLFVGLNKIALAEAKPSIACLAGKAELIGSCLDEAYSKWDKKLNDTYKNVMGYLSKDKKTELRNQQRIWLKERAKKCDGLSSEYAIKACHLDEAQLKALALEDQEADLMPKLFEGRWESCAFANGKQVGCIEQVLFQKGKNICGWWEDGEGSKVSSRRMQFVLIDSLSARSKKVCEEFDFSNMINCYLDEYEEDNRPLKDWEVSNNYAMKICDGKLYRSGALILEKNCQQLDPLLANKHKETIKISDYHKKNTLWLAECLNDK